MFSNVAARIQGITLTRLPQSRFETQHFGSFVWLAVRGNRQKIRGREGREGKQGPARTGPSMLCTLGYVCSRYVVYDRPILLLVLGRCGCQLYQYSTQYVEAYIPFYNNTIQDMKVALLPRQKSPVRQPQNDVAAVASREAFEKAPWKPQQGEEEPTVWGKRQPWDRGDLPACPGAPGACRRAGTVHT